MTNCLLFALTFFFVVAVAGCKAISFMFYVEVKTRSHVKPELSLSPLNN